MPDHPYRPSAQVFSPDCVFPLTQELGPPQGEIPNLSWTRPAGAPEDGDRAVTGLELGFPIFSPEANYVTSLSFKPHIILALQGSTEVCTESTSQRGWHRKCTYCFRFVISTIQLKGHAVTQSSLESPYDFLTL